MAFSLPVISSIVIFLFTFISLSQSIPFIILHGIGDQCSNRGVKRFTELLSNFSGTKGYCMYVKEMKELRNGYNIVGLSQGNLIGRGVLQFCAGGPPVKNFISLGGPHAGTASVPLCGDHLAPSGYLKLPNAIPSYLEKCRFLPKLNNEVPGEKNSSYKERFTSLQNLVLIMFEHDTVLIPKETSWFGYYPDGTFNPVLPPQQTNLYAEDWIGLKTLDEAGKVKYISVPGNHLGISRRDMKRYVVPYLVDKASRKRSIENDSGVQSKKIEQTATTIDKKTSTKAIFEGSSSYFWPSSIKSFVAELLGLMEEPLPPDT
ncbi:hypothetical protein CIPAW_11G083100 [Carya illinoinensis]|uniref:Palmitoyl-protein thioesterase 1-like n=1 Tax=Carya illinoinensis TaxID=32201 RepID=A0A8T1P3S5_CARIL|nr:hypothetical protein CIPAW_11G083100 [Carya illinoinensis]